MLPPAFSMVALATSVTPWPKACLSLSRANFLALSFRITKATPAFPWTLSFAIGRKRFSQQGWKNLFRPIANDNVQGKAGVAFVMRKLKAKKFALLNDKQAFGQGVTEVAKATIEKAGGSITSFGGVEPKDVDYSAVLTKIIKTEHPDAIVYCTNFNTSAGLMVKQIRQLGYKKPVVGCDGYFDPGMPKAAGAAGDRKSDAEAVYITFQTLFFTGPAAPEKVQAFAKKFKEKYNSDPAGYTSTATISRTSW